LEGLVVAVVNKQSRRLDKLLRKASPEQMAPHDEKPIAPNYEIMLSYPNITFNQINLIFIEWTIFALPLQTWIAVMNLAPTIIVDIYKIW
jgi:hypothetical protein